MFTRSASVVPISEWLARAHDDPATVHREWMDRRLAVLPLGRRFDAVRIPVEVLDAALGGLRGLRPAAVAPLLEQVLRGPVIQDDARWFYPLVRVGGAVRWRSHAARYLGQGWLGVPQVDQVAPPGTYWVAPVREPGSLCDLARVAELVEVGAARLASGVA